MEFLSSWGHPLALRKRNILEYSQLSSSCGAPTPQAEVPIMAEMFLEPFQMSFFILQTLKRETVSMVILSDGREQEQNRVYNATVVTSSKTQ